MLKFVAMALAASDVAFSWSCPEGYVGPDQCTGGRCDGNNVVLGRSDHDCCQTCVSKSRHGDHYEYDMHGLCVAAGYQQCCNCWRWSGRRLNATESSEAPPALRGSSGSGHGRDHSTEAEVHAAEAQQGEAEEAPMQTTAPADMSNETSDTEAKQGEAALVANVTASARGSKASVDLAASCHCCACMYGPCCGVGPGCC